MVTVPFPLISLWSVPPLPYSPPFFLFSPLCGARWSPSHWLPNNRRSIGSVSSLLVPPSDIDALNFDYWCNKYVPCRFISILILSRRRNETRPFHSPIQLPTTIKMYASHWLLLFIASFVLYSVMGGLPLFHSISVSPSGIFDPFHVSLIWLELRWNGVNQCLYFFFFFFFFMCWIPSRVSICLFSFFLTWMIHIPFLAYLPLPPSFSILFSIVSQSIIFISSLPP